MKKLYFVLSKKRLFVGVLVWIELSSKNQPELEQSKGLDKSEFQQAFNIKGCFYEH